MNPFAAIRNWFSTRSLGRIELDEVFDGLAHRNPVNADAEHEDPVTIAPWQTEAEERIAKIVERRKEAIRARVEAGK